MTTKADRHLALATLARWRARGVPSVITPREACALLTGEGVTYHGQYARSASPNGDAVPLAQVAMRLGRYMRESAAQATPEGRRTGTRPESNAVSVRGYALTPTHAGTVEITCEHMAAIGCAAIVTTDMRSARHYAAHYQLCDDAAHGYGAQVTPNDGDAGISCRHCLAPGAVVWRAVRDGDAYAGAVCCEGDDDALDDVPLVNPDAVGTGAVRIVYLPVNMAYLVMWHDTRLAGPMPKDDAVAWCDARGIRYAL